MVTYPMESRCGDYRLESIVQHVTQGHGQYIDTALPSTSLVD
jgi:hypothetical protein